VPNPHDPKRATTFALVHLSGGKCYWPTPHCDQLVTVFVNREPVTNLEIAHIRAAEPSGPRYDPDMTDEERRAWPNLIFLCSKHHRFIDIVRPQDYPVAVLERWKAEREARAFLQLESLSGLTEDKLQVMIKGALQEAIRDVEAGINPPDSETASIIQAAARQINPDVADTLHAVSDSLRSAMDPDNIDRLWLAAQTLSEIRWPDTDTLAALVDQLNSAIDELRRMQGYM
jgi:hypothetical protein